MASLVHDSDFNSEQELWYTVGERNGKFVYATEEELQHKSASLGLEKYPNITVTGSGDDDDSDDDQNAESIDFSSPFVPADKHWLKMAWHALLDEGFIKMLEVLNSENGESKCCPSRLFKCLIKASNWMDIQPDPHVTCDRYSSTSLWYSSIIRGTSVHHNLQLIAIATKDDIIEIRNVSNSGIPQAVLKDKRQYCISCLEWAPLSNNLLAVGVTGGVIIWYIDLNTRPVSCFISCFPGRPIVSLSWSPQGNLLACGTPTDSTLMIWNVTLQTCTRLKRNYGGGVSHVSWSPDGGRLLVSYQKMFRVWETTHWTCDRWTQLAGRCNASCWSPAGDILLFAVEDDLSLYYVKFTAHDLMSSGDTFTAAVKCADVSQYNIETPSNDIRFGSKVQSLAWDKNGKRLAVLFADAGDTSHSIAVYRTSCYPIMELVPGGLIHNAGEIPVWSGFINHHHSNNSMLISCWNNGEIMFTPLEYSQSQRNVVEDIKSSFHY